MRKDGPALEPFKILLRNAVLDLFEGSWNALINTIELRKYNKTHS
jgi:hypothetical protein